MSLFLDADRERPARTGGSLGWPRAASRILVACMLLLGAAAAWLVLTRPVHRIEGDFLEREDRQVADEWLFEQLESPVAEIRARALLALARVRRRSAVKALLRGMSDPAPSVRARSAFAAGNVFDLRLGGGRPSNEIAEALGAIGGTVDSWDLDTGTSN